MRPTPIPDAEVWEGATRRVVAAPDGDLTNRTIAPVEALVDRSPSTGALNLSVRCVLEGDDLAKLQAGGTVWLTFWGAMVPWSATVVAPAGEATTSAEPDRVARVLALCDEWDVLSKGETPTTRRIREALS